MRLLVVIETKDNAHLHERSDLLNFQFRRGSGNIQAMYMIWNIIKTSYRLFWPTLNRQTNAVNAQRVNLWHFVIASCAKPINYVYFISADVVYLEKFQDMSIANVQIILPLLEEIHPGPLYKRFKMLCPTVSSPMNSKVRHVAIASMHSF